MTRRQGEAATASLERAARALKWAEVLQGAVWWSVISAGSLLILVGLDYWLRLPTALRLPLAVVLLVFIVIGFYRRVWIPWRRPLSAARTARWLEKGQGIGGNVLINAYQFEKHKPKKEQRRFIRPLLNTSRAVLDAVAPESLWLTAPFKKWLVALGLLVAVWLVTTVAFPHSMTTGVTRIFLPLADVPPVGNWEVEVTPSGRVVMVEGDKLEIRARVRFRGGKPMRGVTPLLIWKEGTQTIEPAMSTGDRAAMLSTKTEGEFVFAFTAVNRPFSFRVWADDSCSAAVEVAVTALPRLKSSVFEVVPPSYTGLKPYQQPGPPMALSVPLGSTVTAIFDLAPSAAEVMWSDRGEKQNLTKAQDRWRTTMLVNQSRHYEISATTSKQAAVRTLAQGDINAIPDQTPEVDFVTEDRNRLVNPGATLSLTIRATDDYGVASIALLVARSDDPATVKVIKQWTLVGPPGQKEPTAESHVLALDPSVFTPGSAFLVTSQATDFSPAKQRATSRPILIRVTGLKDLSVPAGDPLEKLFTLLRGVITEQTRANGLTDNVTLHLAEALAAKDLPRHRDVMTAAQKSAQASGKLAMEESAKRAEAKAFGVKIQMLVNGEMGLALEQIGKITAMPKEKLPGQLEALQKRQGYILNELIGLLGQMASDRQDSARNKAGKVAGDSSPPPITAEKAIAELQDDVKKFVDDQKRIIQATKSLKELRPEDLTAEQEALLGDLAREEAKNAAYFQEKLTDLSKLPLQDFADGKLVSELNEVYQEVEKAAAALYEKKIEIAVPREEAGLEKAAELEQNLERWLMNTPDYKKWVMEEAATQTDVPMAELPKQLEDIIGELLDKEEEMGADVEDVSSTFMDSLDKGAGWGTGDGPMSNMSARGVTGNQLPNNMEVGGRSGEGRSGKSSGQMVEETADGKGGRETPTRLNSTPFEQGSVDDKSKDTKGGATGGGKLAGAGQEGLRGSLPPPAQQKLRRLAEQQSKLRQQAESLAVQLRKQRRPTGDLETAVNAMKKFEEAAKAQNGIAVYQGYHQALDALAATRTAYRGNRVSRIEMNSTQASAPKDLSDTQAESVPAGYEEMTGAYFRSLSETSTPTPDK